MHDDDDEQPEIEMISLSSDEGKTVTLVLRSERVLKNEDVVLELEYYISELSRAADYLERPDTNIH